MKTDFSYVNSGKDTKKYRHDLGFHVNTTSDFGSFQPFLGLQLMGGDKVNINDFTQLVRNSTMPSPTFGNIKCKNEFMFVPMTDVFPGYAPMMEKTSVNATEMYTPTSFPTISNNELVLMLLTSPRFSTYDIFDTKNVYDEDYSGFNNLQSLETSPKDHTTLQNSFVTLLQEVYNNYMSSQWGDRQSYWINLFTNAEDNVSYSFNNQYYEKSHGERLSREAADFIISFDNWFQPGTDVTGFEIRWKLSAAGQRLFKVLRGLGFSLEFTDEAQLDFLPLLAFYKGYYDLYFIQRHSNWHSQAAYKIIDMIYEHNIVRVNTVDSAIGEYLYTFFTDLAECWFTYPADFLSAHVSVLNDGQASALAQDLIKPVGPSGDSFAGGVTVSNVPYSTASVTLQKLQQLSRLTRYFTKQSKCGQRVYKYMVDTYGKKAADEWFKPSLSVGSFFTDVIMDDTYSNADTADINGVGTGQHLGYRGGVGQGSSSNNSLNFEAPSNGFFFGMLCVYPETQWTQGNEGYLYCKTRYNQPTSDFDALGYELTPLGMVYTNNEEITSLSSTILKKSFGFIPRNSFLKTKHSLVNGCMAFRSTRDSFESFFLDKIINKGKFIRNDKADPDHPEKVYYSAYLSSIPTSQGTEWFSPERYPQLGYFNRIFFNSGLPYEKLNVFFDDSDFFPIEDNFVVQFRTGCVLINGLKPMSDSYDLFDESKDNDTANVSVV